MPFTAPKPVKPGPLPEYLRGTLRLRTPAMPKRKRGRIHQPDTMGLRVIFAPMEGMTYGGAFDNANSAHARQKGNEGDGFLFQASPLEEFSESHSFSHADFSTVFGGERSRPAGRGLVEITFNTLWLDDGSKNHAPSWAVFQQAMDPLEAKERLIRLGRTMRPFWVMAHQMPLWHRYDLRMLMTMRALSSVEKAGEEDARYFAISLKEYRTGDVASKKTAGKAGPINRVPPGGVGKTVSLLKDDESTLYEVATKYYGTATMWKTIKAANPELSEVGPSEDLREAFPPGGKKARTLWLPPRTTAPKAPGASTGGGRGLI